MHSAPSALIGGVIMWTMKNIYPKEEKQMQKKKKAHHKNNLPLQLIILYRSAYKFA